VAAGALKRDERTIAFWHNILLLLWGDGCGDEVGDNSREETRHQGGDQDNQANDSHINLEVIGESRTESKPFFIRFIKNKSLHGLPFVDYWLNHSAFLDGYQDERTDSTGAQAGD
jgi:hypothetical protein